MKRTWFVVMLVTAALGRPTSAFSLNITYGGGLSTSQQTTFSEARAHGESSIFGYQAGIARTGLAGTVTGQAMDGLGGTIGKGGPNTTSFPGGLYIANQGSITLDSADLPQLDTSGEFCDLMVHELGHVLGFGTLWTHNGVISDGSGQYTGAFALAASLDEFDPFTSYVPVELDGGPDSAKGHWDEVSGGTGLTGLTGITGITGITDSLGGDLANARMTAWTGPHAPDGGESYLSDTTLMSLQDIGFGVHPAPEPTTVLFVLLAAGSALRRRRCAGELAEL